MKVVNIMKNQIMKRFLTLALSLALVAVCFAVAPTVEVEAAGENGPVAFKSVTNDEFKTMIESHSVPSYNGYLFAGWYQADQSTPIASYSDANGANVTAKFIKADVRGVAMQARYDIETATSTDLRMIAPIDGKNYQAVGFNVYVRQVDATTGKLLGERAISQFDGETSTLQSNRIYTGLKVFSKENVLKNTIRPADAFGRDGWFFYTAKITGIPASMYDNNIIVVQPYWVTLDGTYVPGLCEFYRANDGMNGIVNVTVNLMNAPEIAAGGMSISYDPTDFEYVDYDNGRVFESEFTLVHNNGTITAYGNTSLWGNVLDSNNVFVNLRFKKTAGFDATNGINAFTSEKVDFSDWDETKQNLTVTANAPYGVTTK